MRDPHPSPPIPHVGDRTRSSSTAGATAASLRALGHLSSCLLCVDAAGLDAAVPAPSSTRYAHPPIIFSSCRDEERETASTRSHRGGEDRSAMVGWSSEHCSCAGWAGQQAPPRYCLPPGPSSSPSSVDCWWWICDEDFFSSSSFFSRCLGILASLDCCQSLLLDFG